MYLEALIREYLLATNVKVLVIAIAKTQTRAERIIYSESGVIFVAASMLVAIK